jgi:hypothetical protein
MSKSFFKVSVLAGLALALGSVAWGRVAAPDVEAGRLELTLSSDARAPAAAPIRLRITGLGHSFRANIELRSGGEAQYAALDLPAGLYAVDGIPSHAAAGAVDVVVPVLGAPALAVVSAGATSNVLVRPVEASPTLSALAALDPSAAR